ncbi:hypothetical protein MHYP_G00253870 [Metynnis hypsauchen]
MLAKERRGHAHKIIPANENQRSSSAANRLRRSSAEEPITCTLPPTSQRERAAAVYVNQSHVVEVNNSAAADFKTKCFSQHILSVAIKQLLLDDALIHTSPHWVPKIGEN